MPISMLPLVRFSNRRGVGSHYYSRLAAFNVGQHLLISNHNIKITIVLVYESRFCWPLFESFFNVVRQTEFDPICLTTGVHIVHYLLRSKATPTEVTKIGRVDDVLA